MQSPAHRVQSPNVLRRAENYEHSNSIAEPLQALPSTTPKRKAQTHLRADPPCTSPPGSSADPPRCRSRMRRPSKTRLGSVAYR